MSYILDAVRKAEEERQQSQSNGVRTLGVQAIPEHKPRNTKVWVAGVAAIVLFANTALWFFIADPKERPTQSMAAQESLMLANANGHTNTNDNVEPEELPAHSNDRRVGATAIESPATPGLSEGSIHNGPVTSRTQLLKLWQSSSAAQTAINALEFSFHVYSADESKRTIIINKQRMREGDLISDSLSLESITATGVLLAYEESLIEVEVLEQW